MLSIFRRSEIPIIIAFAIGMLATFEYFIYIPTLRTTVTEFQKWATMITTFSMTISSVNLLRIHSRNVQRKRTGWTYSVLLIISFFAMMLLGLYATFATDMGLLYPPFVFVVQQIQYPINISMFGLLGFYVVSSSWRAFKARGFDATLILVAAFLVMLGQAPIGEVIWDQFPAIRYWIQNVPAVAASRAITIGSAIGALSISIQVMLGYERGWLGRGGE
jgi:hypothetical protein